MVSVDILNTIDNNMYKNEFQRNISEYNIIWNSIKHFRPILEEAIKLKKNKWDELYPTSISICSAILTDYKSIPIDIYNSLVDIIMENEKIAKLKTNFLGDGDFLLQIVFNDTPLSESHKDIILNEIKNGKYHAQNINDLRYFVIDSYNFSEKVKKEILDTYDNEEFGDLITENETSIQNLFGEKKVFVYYDEVVDITDEQVEKIFGKTLQAESIKREIKTIKWLVNSRERIYD